MEHMNQATMIEQMRQRAVNDQTALYQRAGVTVYGQYDNKRHVTHGTHHLLLFLFSICILFFAADYLDTGHNYAAVISDAVTNNTQLQKAYDNIENSDLINWIVEWVTPVITRFTESLK